MHVRRTYPMPALLCAIALLALWLPPPSLAALQLEGDAPLTLDQQFDYLEDRQGTLGLEQLLSDEANLPWQQLAEGEHPNFGYTRSSYWLRIPLQASTPLPQRWMLEIPFPTLDRVELYLVDPGGNQPVTRMISGDRLPFADRAYPHTHIVFPLSLPPKQPRELYLRISSSGSLSVSAQLWPEPLFHPHSRTVYSGLSLYFGILGALLLYNLLLFTSLHDTAYLYYVALVAAMALGQAAWTGIGYEFLWPGQPGWANQATLVGFNAAGFFSALFTRRFLQLGHSQPWLDQLMSAFAAIFLVSLLLTPVVPYRYLAIAISASGLVFSLAAMLSALTCLHRGNGAARYFLLAWGVLLVGVAAVTMRNLGWLPSNLFTNHGMLIGSALEMILLSVALAGRIQLLQREKEHAEHAAMAAHRSMLNVLEQTEQELEHKVRERTRDLEALNQDLKTREKKLKTLAHHDPLTGLYNRLSFETRLNESMVRARLHEQRLVLMMLDLDGFKPVNDRHGHDIGDALLQVVARRLHQHVRSSDTVARIGGDEFLILLENVHTTQELEKIAAGVLQSFDTPVTLNGLKLKVGASIGIALFPEDGDNPEALYKAADKAMYRAKQEGRGRYTLTAAAGGFS